MIKQGFFQVFLDYIFDSHMLKVTTKKNELKNKRNLTENEPNLSKKKDADAKCTSSGSVTCKHYAESHTEAGGRGEGDHMLHSNNK